MDTVTRRRLRLMAAHLSAPAAAEQQQAAVATDVEQTSASPRVILRERGPLAMKEALMKELQSGKIPDETTNAEGFRVSDHLPGPLTDHSREELLVMIARAEAEGTNHTQWMDWQEEYGDAGLNSNIVVPHLARSRSKGPWITEKVLLSDPDDCLRIARAHTQKQPNFQLFMGDSVISATENEVWRPQRNSLTEAFLPTSSLSKIFPISVQRAQQCVEILKRLSQAGDKKVNMTEFFLNETQQQLHLALFGETDTYDEDYNAVFRDSMGGPPGDDRYAGRHHGFMEQQKKQAAAGQQYPGGAFEALAVEGSRDPSVPTATEPVGFLRKLNDFIRAGSAAGKFAAPSHVAADPSKKISGPLSAVLADQMDRVHTSDTMGAAYDQLPASAQDTLNRASNLGNAFIFAFAGHDTTGHTLTWL
jgi:hypothetical protein